MSEQTKTEIQDEPKKRQLGAFAGRYVEIDRNWWRPMTDEEVDAFIGPDDLWLTRERT